MNAAVCRFCGEPEQVSVHEVWGHDFMLDTCCASLQDHIVEEMKSDPDWARHLLRTLDIDALCGRTLRRVADIGATMVLDWQLRIGPGLGHLETRAFIARHHAHCLPPVTWRFGATIYNGPTVLGLAIVGNPVARAFMGRGIVEVNRVCLRRDLPDALRWNAASMLYAWCAREAQCRGWRKIITYTRADEPGTSLRAAGWTREATIRGRGWHNRKRLRSNANAWIDKVRWARTLFPAAQRKGRPLSEAAKFREETSVALASHA